MKHLAMRPSEIVTLYLATAAPFGVAYFLRRQAACTRDDTTAAAVALAAGVALAWPFALVATFLGARGERLRVTEAAKTAPPLAISAHEAKIESAKRTLLASLREVEELMEDVYGARQGRTRQTLFETRASVERYTGLVVLAGGEAEEDGDTAPPELELWRVAGRTGADLKVAARCLQRRNAARLLAHRNSARMELLHALAEVRELGAGDGHPATAGTGAARKLSAAILEAFGRGIELLSLLEDQQAAMGVARLLDAECERLRRLESFNLRDVRDGAHAGEPCTPPTLRRPPPTLPAPTSPLRRPEASPSIPTPL